MARARMGAAIDVTLNNAEDDRSPMGPRFTVAGPSRLVNQLLAGRIEEVAPEAQVEIAVDPAQPQTRITAESDGSWVLVGGLSSPELTLAHAVAHGAKAAISLRDGLAEFDRALVALMGGAGPYVPDRVLRELAARNDAAPARPVADAPKVTPREQEVLDLVVDGCTNGEVASRLGMSPNTVRTHLRSLFEKLNVSNRVALMRRADELGLSGDSSSRVERRPGWDQIA